MPKTKISEYSVTNSSNTDIEGINIDEGCAPSGINNAIRELMVHLKEFQTGASGDAFTFAGGVLISGTANTITGNVLMSGTNTITGSTTATFAAGAVGTPSIAAHGDTNTGIYFPAADTIAFAEGGAEAMRIDSSGNVGIGTSSPGSRLHIKGAASANVELLLQPNADTNSGVLSFRNAANTSTRGYVLYDFTSDYMAFRTAVAEQMRIDSSGNVGIGTTSPDTKLQVAATGSVGASARSNTSGDSYFRVYLDSTIYGHWYADRTNSKVTFGALANVPLTFVTNDTERARIASGGQFCVNTTNTNGAFNVSGNVYLFSQSSGAGNSTLKWDSTTGKVTYDTSSRLVKENIVDSSYGLAEVMRLKSRKYFRIDDQREEIGLVADEVIEVLPEFVPISPKSIFTGNEQDNELVPSGVNYDKLSSVLIKAIQELKAITDAQATRIEALEAEVAALKAK